MDVQSRDLNSWFGCRANRGLLTGKWYFEATVEDEGLCRVGFSSQVLGTVVSLWPLLCCELSAEHTYIAVLLVDS